MPSDVLETPGPVRPVAEVEPPPLHIPFADMGDDLGLMPARGIAKAVMISMPFWLLIGLGIWAF